MTKQKRPIRILHVSTHHESCGIGKYQEAFLKEMENFKDVYNEFYPTSLNKIKILNQTDLEDEMSNLKRYAQSFDIVHIQHEFGLFRSKGEGLSDILDALSEKPTIITIHTAPSLLLVDNKFDGIGPRNILNYSKTWIINWKTRQKKIYPLRRPHKIITLNSYTKKQLVSIAHIPEEAILQRTLPIQTGVFREQSDILRKHIAANKSDTLLCTVGFVHQFKGVDHAVRALALLPKNYKLAVLGGTHPDSGDPRVLDSIKSLVKELGLGKRVFFAGFIKQDKKLFDLIRGSDVALFPYSLEYYRLASSDAINKALMNHVPVVAYPTESFKELHQLSSGAIELSPEASPESLASTIMSLRPKELIRRADAFIEINSLEAAAKDLVSIYKEMLT
jgi:glycosyltransferase involved in cell wall biosynthesis